MKRDLMGVGFLALCFVLVASMATATPTCSSLVTSGAVDVDPGGSGSSITCMQNGLIFSNFSYVVAGGSGTPVIEITQNGVTVNGGEVDINFNPNISVTSGISDLHFIFQVTGFITGASLQNAGFASAIQETNCSGQENLNGVCSGNILWATSDGDNQSSFCNGNTSGGTGFTTTCAFGNGVSGMWVFKDLGANLQEGGHISSFTEDFQTTATAPEPVTMSLMGIGLLGIGLLGRRIRK